jgi:S-(hydroxymethyl)glutathione dehydrogenase/alcohol dehydrogenase
MGDRVSIRAAVFEGVGRDLEIAELELAPPGPGEVRVRLDWSGVCHSDLNVVDGKMGAPLPVVLGHEGAGTVEAGGPGVSLAVGQRVALSWAPSCGACEECGRGLRHLCGAAWPAMATGGLMDGTTRLSRNGEQVFHDSFLSTYAEATVVPAASCVPIPVDAPLDIAAIVGCAVTTGIGAVWNTAETRPGDRVAVFGCGGVGLSAVMGARAAGAAQVIAVDVIERKLADAVECGATATVLWRESPEATAAAVEDASGGGVDAALECTGRSEVATACFLSTRARGAAVLVGIPAADAIVEFPALPFPRKERRVLGSEYGSAYPPHMFPLLLDLYRRGQLDLDRLVSHRLPLSEVGEALDLLRSGGGRRTLLDVRA